MNRIFNLPDTSRVWIYLSNRVFTDNEVAQINEKIAAFTQGWASHGQDLAAAGAVVQNRFVILGVDQSRGGASGCSIDSSVHFVKQLEADYGVDLFDRMLFAFEVNGELQVANRDAFGRLYSQGTIDDNTTVYNNLVDSVGGLKEGWKIKLSESWHARMV